MHFEINARIDINIMYCIHSLIPKIAMAPFSTQMILLRPLSRRELVPSKGFENYHPQEQAKAPHRALQCSYHLQRHAED